MYTCMRGRFVIVVLDAWLTTRGQARNGLPSCVVHRLWTTVLSTSIRACGYMVFEVHPCTCGRAGLSRDDRSRNVKGASDTFCERRRIETQDLRVGVCVV